MLAAEAVVLDDRPSLASQLPPPDVDQDVWQELDQICGEQRTGCGPRPTGEIAHPAPSYFEADSLAPTAACPAARRAVSTRYGEQLT
jgi:hypothetical protein